MKQSAYLIGSLKQCHEDCILWKYIVVRPQYMLMDLKLLAYHTDTHVLSYLNILN